MTDNLGRAEEAFRRAVQLGGGEWSYRGLARVLAQLGRDRGEVLRLLDECPYAESPAVQELRDEIACGSWDRITEA
jgi:ABC-type hemin transport system ATPase subunit